MIVFLHNEDWTENTWSFFNDLVVPVVGDEINLTTGNGALHDTPLGGRRWEVTKRSFSDVGANTQRIDITMRETS